MPQFYSSPYGHVAHGYMLWVGRELVLEVVLFVSFQGLAVYFHLFSLAARLSNPPYLLSAVPERPPALSSCGGARLFGWIIVVHQIMGTHKMLYGY